MGWMRMKNVIRHALDIIFAHVVVKFGHAGKRKQANAKTTSSDESVILKERTGGWMVRL